MSWGFTAGRRPVSALALLAMLALAVGLLAGPQAGASGSGDATAAKKKCKKKGKKKKCKKKRAVAPVVPVAAPVVPAKPAPPAKIVRATLTWTDDGDGGPDLDLYAFDASGNVDLAIPNSAFSGDIGEAPGGENFLAPAGGEYSYGVCAYSEVFNSTDATVTVVHGNGSTEVITPVQVPALTMTNKGNYANIVEGPFDPTGLAGAWCRYRAVRA